MMISVGNFFFKYRNILFIVLYLLLFIPSPAIFSQDAFGNSYYWWPVITGLFITITGQAIRGATIGLAYIVRGGKDKKVYAEELVTQGIFNHCRNPLYVGNILMLLGVGVLANSLLYVIVVIPVFLFIYQTIVLAEEHFLLNKFGPAFITYCKRVNRWLPNLNGIAQTFRNMHFNWSRWILKEYNTQFIWLTGILIILLFYYPELTHYKTHIRNSALGAGLLVLIALYMFVRYIKKSQQRQVLQYNKSV